MRLMDAYNAIFNGVFQLIKHLFLLLIKGVNHQQIFVITLLQRDAY